VERKTGRAKLALGKGQSQDWQKREIEMVRQYKTPKFTEGDKVAYSVQFLKSIGMNHGDIARARGTITSFMLLGTDTQLASITWDRGELPSKVNTANLARVGPNPRFCNVD